MDLPVKATTETKVQGKGDQKVIIDQRGIDIIEKTVDHQVLTKEVQEGIQEVQGEEIIPENEEIEGMQEIGNTEEIQEIVIIIEEMIQETAAEVKVLQDQDMKENAMIEEGIIQKRGQIEEDRRRIFILTSRKRTLIAQEKMEHSGMDFNGLQKQRPN